MQTIVLLVHNVMSLIFFRCCMYQIAVACIHLGKMYIAQGISPEKFLWLRVIDLKQRKLIKSYNLKEAGFKREPEGCFVWRDCLMLTTSRKFIFIMNIPINE